MPKAVHDAAEKMVADKSFYPDKSEEERKSIAWAIATKNYKKKKKQSFLIPEKFWENLFEQNNEPGFQVVHIHLTDNRVIQGVKVYNCTEGVVPDWIDAPDVNEIVDVEVVW